jgi:hypothetical protein
MAILGPSRSSLPSSPGDLRSIEGFPSRDHPSEMLATAYPLGSRGERPTPASILQHPAN